MPVELRKRKAREPPAPPPAPAKKRTPAAKTGKAAAAKVKAAPAKAPGKRGRPAKAKVEEEPAKEEEEKKEEEKVEEEKEEEKTEEKVEEPKETKKKSDKAEVGDVVDLDGFGGEIETNEGEKTTLKALVDESKAGVVLFTYPKASTPGCKLTPPTYLTLFAQFTNPPSQAQSRSASSATRMSPSPQAAWQSTVSAPTLPRPTRPSRTSRSSLTLCCATPRRRSSVPSASRRFPRAPSAASLSLTRRARSLLPSPEAPRVLLTG
jgi:hypothetical protein